MQKEFPGVKVVWCQSTLFVSPYWRVRVMSCHLTQAESGVLNPAKNCLSGLRWPSMYQLGSFMVPEKYPTVDDTMLREPSLIVTGEPLWLTVPMMLKAANAGLSI